MQTIHQKWNSLMSKNFTAMFTDSFLKFLYLHILFHHLSKLSYFFAVWWQGIHTSPLCIWPAVFFQLLWKLSSQSMVDIHVWSVVHKGAMEHNFLPLHFGFLLSITPPPTIYHPSNWVLLNIISLSPCIHACRYSYSGLRITMIFH